LGLGANGVAGGLAQPGTQRRTTNASMDGKDLLGQTALVVLIQNLRPLGWRPTAANT
jgi:hypothetical protein